MASETPEAYFESSQRMAGSSRSSSRPRRKTSPSAQLRVARGETSWTSTDYTRSSAGRAGRSSSAAASRRATTTGCGSRRRTRIAGVLAAHGVVSRFWWTSAPTDDPAGDWKLTALEINLRMGHDPPLFGLAVPHRGQPRPRHPAFLPQRPRQVLQGDRQPLLGAVPGAAA